MSNNPDQIVEKYLKMKTKMKRTHKSNMDTKNGSVSSVASRKTIEVKDLEADKTVSMLEEEKEMNKICDLGPVDWPDDDPRWGNPPTIGSLAL